MTTLQSANLNHFWSKLIIEELIRNGVEYFCISPGSRSTPLSVAVAENKRAQSFIHFDERGSAFHALGYTSARSMPSCIITTSGTAVANLFPAVIEASKKKLPLIVITADRPPELRFTGANQTIDQVKIFGEYVRWFFDVPTPDTEIKPEFILTTIDQAVWQAKSSIPGPVHLNCMFREPLSPEDNNSYRPGYAANLKSWSLSRNKPFTQYCPQTQQIDPKDLTDVAEILNAAVNGVVAVGKLTTAKDQAEVLKLANRLNWPVFADITSGLRLGKKYPNVISYYDQILKSKNTFAQYMVGTILHLGGRMTSKEWYAFIEKIRPKQYITVLNHSLRNDPLHIVSHRVESRIFTFCAAIQKRISQKPRRPFLTQLQAKNAVIERKFETFFSKQKILSEAETLRIISQKIPKNHALFISNSLPIRTMDTFAATDKQAVAFGSNRGASGIDGTIASACGFSKGLNKPVTLVVGDLAFLYDLNSLAMLTQLNNPMTVVVLNNNGGGIFNFLPVAKQKKYFEKYFAAPHHLTFKDAASLFRLNYHCPKDRPAFIHQYAEALKSTSSSIIEMHYHREHNIKLHNTVNRLITNEQIRRVKWQRKHPQSLNR